MNLAKLAVVGMNSSGMETMRNLLLKSESSLTTPKPVCLETTGWSADGSTADLPCWVIPHEVDEIDETKSRPSTNQNLEILDRFNGKIRHRTVILRNAALMDDATFTAQAHTAYVELLRDACRDRIFRIWNFIPEINREDVDGINRYMCFNTARFNAFATTPDENGYPPASGVGHAGNDLVLHLMEGEVSSIQSLDNPRQIQPSEYSQTWGPLPPVFARAAIVEGLHDSPFVVVSGTASVRGEDTVFTDDLDQQLAETRQNLAHLLAEIGESRPLLDSMLVYVTRHEHLKRVQHYIESECLGQHVDVEYRIGPLCRRELLVEIEGIRILEPRDMRP